MPRSRSSSPHGRHRSKSPGKHGHGKHHDRSKSPGKHGHKHHGRSKSPKHGHHKHDHEHGHHGHGHKKHHSKHGRSKSPRRDSDSGDEDDGPEEEFAEKLHIADEPEAEASAPPVPDEEVEAEPAATKVSTPVVAAAMAAPVMAMASAAAVPTAEVVEEEEEEVEEEEKIKFTMTKNFGGDGGTAFDHMNRRRVAKISVRAGKFVDGISMTYHNGQTVSNGGDGGEEQSIELPEGEYVNEVKVVEGNVIQALTFSTNKGRSLGPCGSGKGGGLGIFAKEGNCVVVKAPEGCRLVGIKGREGKWLDGIGFRWGPVPKRS